VIKKRNGDLKKEYKEEIPVVMGMMTMWKEKKFM
jgi:hypothetical protein